LQIGRRLENLGALRRIGFAANRRLLSVQTLSHDCTIGAQRFSSLVEPAVIEGQRVSALPFGNFRVLALMHTLCLLVFAVKGIQAALFYTRAYGRFFRLAFSEPIEPNPKPHTPVSRALHNAAKAVDRLIEQAKLAA
jgi:hypothetical protein